MKKFLHHIQQHLVFGLTIFSCLSMYPAASVQPPATLDALSDTTTSTDSDDDNPNPTPPHPDDEDPDDEEEPYDFQTDLIIYALSPGYSQTTDHGKLSDVGEFIELQNLTDAPLALAGYSIVYTNGSGNDSTLFTFPEESYLTGKRLLLRYYKSPEAQLADLNYRTTLAFKAGPLKLLYQDELVDSVCWAGGKQCESAFTSAKPELLQRNLFTGDFERLLVEAYEPSFDPTEERLILPDEPSPEEPDSEEEIKPAPQCQGLEFSELLTYYAEDKSEQFIELFNPTGRDIILDGCRLAFKNKFYELSGSAKSGEYFTYYPSAQFSLTKNPKNPLTLALIDLDDSVVDEISYPNGQKKTTSYARIFDETGQETWQITYAITPGAENVYQKFRTCEAGKIINEATGNCVKVTSVKTTTSTLKSTSTLAPCPTGKYRNPLTGRCKNIASATSTLKECAEGYERNPETNRCRKVASTKSNDGADYALVPKTSTNHTVFIGISIVILIIALGLIYIILQFRHEIARAARKTSQRLNHIRQNLLARRVGRDRDQKP